jgi:EmrB/QacA subfamily drug resistance transporter
VDDRRRRRALYGVMLSIFLAALESTVVATAMPTVVRSLGDFHAYSWVFSGFLLTSTVTMPLWGRLSDLFGRRRAFLAGMVIFLAGSALCGIAQTMPQLIGFRMLQGLGAGSLMTIGMTIVADLYGLERRARMQGYLSGVWGIASLLGPLLGGFLTDHISWRWVFYLNVPFGALAMVMIATALGAAAAPRQRPAIDLAGLGLFAAGVSALLFGTVEAGRTGVWSAAWVVGPLVGAVVALALFVLVERRAADPIVPLRLFGNRMVVAGLATGFLSGMAMFGAISFVPLFVQEVIGASATMAGFVLTPFVLGWVSMSVLSARLLLRLGYRPLVVTGMLCLAGAFVLFAGWNGALTVRLAMRDVLLAGVGMGMIFVPTLVAVQSAVPRADLGVATSVIQFFRAVGGAIGLSIMGAVMAQRLAARLPMADALHGVFVVGAVVCVAAFLSAFLVPGGRAQDLARPEMQGEPTRAGG